jgi:membrane protease YdiL (CAAX protease family)
MGPVAAIAVQGVLFGMAHISPERGVRNIGLVMVLSGVGVVLGTSAYLLRRLGPTMIAHAIINGIAMAIVLSGWSPSGG